MEVLWQDRGLDQLNWWLPELTLKFEWMLMEYHDIFFLHKNKIGCTDMAEYIIELLDDELFKEHFWQIALPLLEEVEQNLQDMLDGDAFRPSQSPWCNAVVLVQKKDGTVPFCIDFWRLNARTKKDAYPLPQMQETIESMVGSRFFSTMDLNSGFWQVKMLEKSWQYTAFMVGSMAVFKFLRMPYGLCNSPGHLPVAHAELAGRAKPHVHSNLPGWCYCFFPDRRGTPTLVPCCFWKFLGIWA